MTEIKLSLLENAVDSLNEALAKYEEGLSGDIKSYKFCIQNLSHFFELVLKHHVTQSHPLLIYKKPFDKKINEASQTIGLYEAMNILKNDGHTLPDGFESDLSWLKKTRNSIEHYQFSMKTSEVDDVIGRLMSAYYRFSLGNESLKIDQCILPDRIELFQELAESYEARLQLAIEKSKAAQESVFEGLRLKEYSLVESGIYTCDACNNKTLAPSQTSKTGYLCNFCGNDYSSDMEVKCDFCNTPWPISDLMHMQYEDGGKGYVCPQCSHHPDYDDD